MLGSVLRGHKHQHARPVVLLDQMAQQLGAAARIHRNGALFDGGLVAQGVRHLYPHGVLKKAIGQRLHCSGKGGREKQVLPPGGQQRQHALQFVGKAQVQQPVGFVQHQVRHGRQAQRVVVHQVQQAPRRGHHNVGTAAQAQHLRVDGYAAKHDGDLERLLQVLRQAAQHFSHLRCQFAGGHQHQGTHPARAAGCAELQLLQQGQCKCRRLARARLCCTQQIYPLQDGRNRARLNGRGRHKARLGGSVDKGGGETEGSKRHGKALERR